MPLLVRIRGLLVVAFGSRSCKHKRECCVEELDWLILYFGTRKMPKKKAKKEKDSTVSSLSSNNKKEASDQIPLDRLLWSPSRLAAEQHKRKPPQTDEILPGFVWVVHDFLLPEECQAWIDFVDGSATSAKSKLEYVQHPATKFVANRECFRWQRNDQQISGALFQRMDACGIVRELQEKAGISNANSNYNARACNPNIRLYKYEKGMAFGKHVDGSHPVNHVGMTEVTVLIYLSDCQGGATRFYPAVSSSRSKGKDKSIAFVPKKGALLVHIHGDRCLEHEADPVLSGVKYILRTDLVYSS